MSSITSNVNVCALVGLAAESATTAHVAKQAHNCDVPNLIELTLSTKRQYKKPQIPDHYVPTAPTYSSTWN